MIGNDREKHPAIGDMIAAFALPVLVIGTAEKIVALNDAAGVLFGTNAAGRHFTTVLRHPKLVDAVERGLVEAISCTVSYQSIESGTDTFYDVHLAPIAHTDLLLLTFQNVTPVAQAGQMRSDFVANVSHELRTPLTAVMGFIDTLRGSARNDATARVRFLDIMADEAERMNRLVGGLLSLSRVEADERVRPTARIDLRDMLQTALRNLAPLAARRNVTLQFDPESEPLAVMGDADQMLQVFSNLIENAINYGGADRMVKITALHVVHDPILRGPATEIVVADQGPGIDPIHLPRLTERFYRADTHRSRDFGGTGLGLAIVKHILNRHRGRLKIASQPGTGSQFTVVLPPAGADL